jgi:predicted adenine nucleotide alpha hydrolase (AANH) superfamily ATPase
VFNVVRVKRDPRFSVLSEMADLKEQSICVKICFKLGRTASKAHEMLETAFGDNANVLSTSEQSEINQVEHQEHVDDFF